MTLTDQITGWLSDHRGDSPGRRAPRRPTPLPVPLRSRVNALTFPDLAEIDVGRLKGVGDKKRTSLASIEVDNLLDLLSFYPRRWVDRSNEAAFADLVPGEEALVLATVRSVIKRVTRNRRTMVNVNVGDGSGRMDVVFFNQPWRERQLARVCRSRCSARPSRIAAGCRWRIRSSI